VKCFLAQFPPCFLEIFVSNSQTFSLHLLGTPLRGAGSPGDLGFDHGEAFDCRAAGACLGSVLHAAFLFQVLDYVADIETGFHIVAEVAL
jgi:hypothetical protein